MFLQEKDPVESIVVEFLFAGELASITSATVTVTAIPAGGDPNAGDMLVNPAQIVGTRVLQRVAGGIDGKQYQLRCEATDGSNVLVRVGTLPVRRFP